MDEVNSTTETIERGLDILRSRHTLMERSARITKVAFVAFVAIMAVPAIYGMVVVLAAAIFIADILVIAAMLAVTMPSVRPRVRRIDIVTPGPFAPWLLADIKGIPS